MSLKLPVSDRDHMEGDANAPIELVEYGDYQCPYCGKAYYEVKKVQQEMGDKLKFVFRNFPLANMHEHAVHAAIASEVAGEMGKFWQMHDLLFENQTSLSDSALLEYAQKVGIEEKEFESKFTDKKFLEKVEEDMESGLRSGVNGTPSFFINGEKYEGDYTADAMTDYLRSME